MKRSVVLAAALLGAGFSAPALAVGFTAPYAEGNFQVTNTGTLLGGSQSLGKAVFTATTLVLTGSDSASPGPGSDAASCAGSDVGTLGPCQLQAVVSGAGVYTFHWDYTAHDEIGPGADIFGVIVDGQRTELSDFGGIATQSGNGSFTALTSFGFFINCTDCIGGNATSTVSNFAVTPVPEPASYAMTLAGLLGLGVFARRRQR